MHWAVARERLGAELIGAREAIALRWRSALREQGHIPRATEPLAAELILQAGAALADEMPSETPWVRCGGVLRLDARDGGRALFSELAALWHAMSEQLERLSFSDDEEQHAGRVLSQQLEAALRGASAEVALLLLDRPVDDPALRFGGIKLVCWTTSAAVAVRAA